MKDLFPAIDLLAQNTAVAMFASVVLLVCAQLVVVAVLRTAARLMQMSVFEDVTGDDRRLLESRVRRSARRIVLLLSFFLMLGAVLASYLGQSALGLGQATLDWLRAQDLVALQTRFLKSVGLVLAAVTADATFRAAMTALDRGLLKSKRLASHHALLTDALTRFRSAGRAILLAETLIFLGETLQVPAGFQHVLTLLACAGEALFASRAISRVGYLVADIGFGLAEQLTRLDGPLRALSDLKNLTAITKRISDYLVYVGAATWVAGQTGTASWYYNAGQVGLRLLVIFYACRVLVEVSILLVQELLSGTDALTDVDVQRRRTLLPVIRGFLRYGIYFTGLIMGLSEANIDPTPLLAGAGVVGVAIGFGAQTFVGDVVAGFFILLEDLILVGDVVEIGEIQGTVEEIGVRITQIRDDFGVLHCIPNGEVRKVANHSRGYVNAVVDVFVPYEEDLRRVLSMLEALAAAFLVEIGVVKGDTEIKVLELSEAAVKVRLVVPVPPGRDEDLGDSLRRRVVSELTQAGIGAPRPRRAVILDSAVRVGPPPRREVEENDSGPVNPFSPAAD